MSSPNLITSGTQAIQTLRTGISLAASGIGGGISLIVGKTGLNNTTFWLGGKSWIGISGIWSNFAPFFNEVGVILGTGYCTGLIFTVLSLFALKSMVSSIHSQNLRGLLGTLASLVACVAFGMLAYVAFTYETAMVVLA